MNAFVKFWPQGVSCNFKINICPVVLFSINMRSSTFRTDSHGYVRRHVVAHLPTSLAAAHGFDLLAASALQEALVPVRLGLHLLPGEMLRAAGRRFACSCINAAIFWGKCSQQYVFWGKCCFFTKRSNFVAGSVHRPVPKTRPHHRAGLATLSTTCSRVVWVCVLLG